MFQEDYLWVRTAMMGQPTWSTDRKHRPDDPNNSKKILLDWLTYPSNYTKFKGKVNNGTTTLHFTQIIATKMNATKVKIHHDAKQVLNKLKHLEDTFQRACNTANPETGVGYKEAGSLKKKFRKRVMFTLICFPLCPIGHVQNRSHCQTTLVFCLTKKAY